MRSDGLGRALACILAGLTCGYLGQMVAVFCGPLLFLPSPKSYGAENSTAILALLFFLLFGLGGVVLCKRMTVGLPESEPKDPNVGIITSRKRCLAIAKGLVVAVTSWSGFGLYSVLLATVLVMGALLQRHSQRYGFWMMFVPAVFLSAWMLPFGFFLLYESVRTITLYHDLNMVIVTSLWTGSLLLLTCCDVALISEGFKLKLFSEVKT